MSYDAWKLQAPPDHERDHGCWDCARCWAEGPHLCLKDVDGYAEGVGVVEPSDPPCERWEEA